MERKIHSLYLDAMTDEEYQALMDDNQRKENESQWYYAECERLQVPYLKGNIVIDPRWTTWDEV